MEKTEIEQFVKYLVNKEFEQKMEQLKEEFRSGRFFTVSPLTSSNSISLGSSNTSTHTSNSFESRPPTTYKRYVPPSMRNKSDNKLDTEDVFNHEMKNDKQRTKKRIPRLSESLFFSTPIELNLQAKRIEMLKDVKNLKPSETPINEYDFDIFKNVEEKRSDDEWLNYAEQKIEKGEFCLNPLIILNEFSRVSKSAFSLSSRFKY